MHTNTLTKKELINRYNYLVKKHNATSSEKKEKKYRAILKNIRTILKTL
jgi:hypothetical protein